MYVRKHVMHGDYSRFGVKPMTPVSSNAIKLFCCSQIQNALTAKHTSARARDLILSLKIHPHLTIL